MVSELESDSELEDSSLLSDDYGSMDGSKTESGVEGIEDDEDDDIETSKGSLDS